MPVITPETTVKLASVPFDKTQNHVLRFSDLSAQLTYFNGKLVPDGIVQNCSYVRQESVLRVPRNIDDMLTTNYVFYQNANYSDKWFFAFVDKVEYVNESTTALTLLTDVMQTWMFDVTYQPSFVVREHVTTDTPGLHTIEENLATGDMIQTAEASVSMEDLCILVGLTVENVSPYANVSGSIVGNQYSGCAVYYYRNDSTGATALNTLLLGLAGDGKSDAVVFMVLYPNKFGQASGMVNGSRVPGNLIAATRDTLILTKRNSGAFTDLDGVTTYTPKNKKLYTYPYNYLRGTNNQGSEVKLLYELFASGSTCEIDLQGDPKTNPTIFAIPMSYNGVNYALDFALTMKNYPFCSWNTDVFKQWVGQNYPSILAGGVAAVGALGVGIATMNPIALGAGALAVANQIGNYVEKSVLPAQYSGGNQNGSNCGIGLQRFEFFQVHLKAEHARKLDGYFELFGYKINELKVPNITGRPYWNYVQLLDPNITGDIPNQAMDEIKRIVTQGVTFWHTTTGFLNYALNNH